MPPSQNHLFPPDPLWDAVIAAVQAYSLKEYGRQATYVVIGLSHGASHRTSLPLVKSEGRPAAREWASGPVPKHLSDFQKVYWPGLGEFTFTRGQAPAVKLLWEAFEDGSHWVSQQALLRAAGSDASKCSDLFRRGEAWKKLIVGGEGALYRLAPLPGVGGEE